MKQKHQQHRVIIISWPLVRRLRKNLKTTSDTLGSLNVSITTSKLKSYLGGGLNSSVPKPLRSHLVYEISCSTCCGIYVGQTVRHLDTHKREHGNKTTPVGKHRSICGLKYVLIKNIRHLTFFVQKKIYFVSVTSSTTKPVSHIGNGSDKLNDCFSIRSN